MQPAKVAKIIVDEDTRSAAVVVNEDQQSLAIGRRGQNVRLASQLTGWNIDVMNEAEEQDVVQKKLKKRQNCSLVRWMLTKCWLICW